MLYPIFPTVDTTRAAGFNWKLPLKVSPSFRTLVQTPANNRGEVRIALTQYPLWKFEMDLPYIYGDPDLATAGFQSIIGFYGQNQGAAGPWLFDWPGNDTATAQVITPGQNFLFWSQDFSQAVWVPNGNGASTPVITPNAVTAPDGTLTGNKIVFPTTGASQTPDVIQSLTNSQCPSISQKVTFSVWLRTDTTGNIKMYVDDLAGANGSGISTLALTNAWQRFSVTLTNPGGSAGGALAVIFQDQNLSAINVYAWGAQINFGAAPPAAYTETQSTQSPAGGIATFPLVHNIGGMTELIQNFQAPPTISVNGSLASSANYSIDGLGNLTFNSGSIPTVGQSVSWSGAWYTLCRFLEDDLQSLSLNRGNGATSQWSLKSLKFVSVLL